MPATRFILVLCLLLLLGGCTGMSEQACSSSDWRAVGFEDGTLGRPVSAIGNYRQACGRHGISPDLEHYRSGHAEGVQVYCRPGRGFDVGRHGQRYQGVCPAGLEQDFLAAYNSGRHLYELEAAVRGIDSRIASNTRAQAGIKEEMTEIAATIASSDTTVEERVRLVARAAELGSRHAELAAENEALKEERLFREIELEDYRQTLAYGS